MAPTCFSLALKKGLKETSLFVEAAEHGAGHLAHDSPLPILCVSPAQPLPFHLSLGLTALE